MEEGILVAVVNARFVKPLDEELLLNIAQRMESVLTVEENALMGGFGSAVLELFANSGANRLTVARLGIGDEFSPQGTRNELLRLHKIDTEGIAAAVRGLCGVHR